MALQKDRTRIFVRGLGNLWLLRKEPTVDTAFYSAGYLKNTTITDTNEMEEIRPENGLLLDILSKTRTVDIETNLEQTSIDEIELVRNASDKVHSVRYYGKGFNGRFQYYCADQARIVPGLKLSFAPGERLLPLKMQALGQDLAYEIPEYYVVETNDQINIDGLQFWLVPRAGLNLDTAKILDVSGWYRHGDVSADFASIWQDNASPTLPEHFLRFDGTNDSINMGNVTLLNDDASGDFVIELWMKFPSGGAQEEILTKKALVSDNTAGWAIFKTAGNVITAKVSTGAASVNLSTTGTITTAWKHFAMVVDRNGNLSTYLNGAADGTPTSISALATGTNTQNIYIGRDGTNFGQVDVGDVRIHRWITGGLPTNIATIIAAHYNGEKALYGL